LWGKFRVAGAVVKPGGNVVAPRLEMVRNEDGQEKQDCEWNAAKRRLENNGQRYGWLKPTLLGEDLYSDYTTRKAVLERGYSFIFTRTEESHRAGGNGEELVSSEVQTHG
jgi:hypothetical protein